MATFTPTWGNVTSAGMPTQDAPGPDGGPLLLAVDGGATKTDALILRSDGAVLGRCRGPASNHQLVGMDTAMANLDATVAGARRAARLAEGTVLDAASLCLAGLDLEVDEEHLAAAVGARDWARRVRLRNDTFAVLRTGSGAAYAVAVVCGTGLNCAAVGPGGAEVRFPALGELSGDFAPGGVWLGVRGLGLALRAGDGRGRPTALAHSVPRHFSLPTAEAVLEAVYSGALPFGRLAELARVVLEEAAAGDAEATRAVDFLADEVVAMAGAAVSRLEVPPEATLDVVVGGGVFEDRAFTATVLAGIRALVPHADLHPPEGPPVLGAALLALDDAGAPPTAHDELRATLPRVAPVQAG